MLKVFRRIRQKLSKEGNLKKYLIYAFGEITLIIIGIMLALQINNWNTNNEIKAESQELLIRLVEGLKEDQLYLESQKLEYESWLGQIDFILNQLLDNDSLEIAEWSQFAAGRMSLNLLKIDQVTYSEMFNSGKVLIFSDDEIINQIKNYYQYAEIELEKLNTDNEIFYKWSLETYGDEFNIIHRLLSGRNLEYIDWSWRKDPSRKEYRHIESINIYYKLAIETNIELINNLQNRTKQLIEIINKELH